MKDLFNAYRLLAFALAISSGACGMTVQAAGPARCQVVHGDKLPVESGGVAALCAAIERAAALNAKNEQFTVQIKVGTRSILSADVTLSDGRKLPALRMAEMDRPISRSTFDRFGAAIANHVAEARR